jgi:hypothetical protein
MALRTYPYDFLLGFPGTAHLDLDYVQEVSPTRGGAQNSADLGPALWRLDAQSRRLKASEFRLWKARLASLENGAKTFKGYDLTACYPLAYPRGTWPTGLAFDGSGYLAAVNTSNYKELKIGGLPVGYVISEGDFLSFAYGSFRALHQAMASVTVGGTGISDYVEVRPAIRSGSSLTAALASSPPTDVDLIKPHATMVLIPGSVSAQPSGDGSGSISFSARQTITAA